MNKTFDTRTMLILRGCPGCGKSTAAEMLKMLMQAAGKTVVHCEADRYLYNQNGEYVWNHERLIRAHSLNNKAIKAAMENDIDYIIVSNTTCKEKDLQAILRKAEEYNYKTVVMTVENRHGGTNSHGASYDKLKRMAGQLRSSMKLIPDE